jgi:hypothetical protein
MRVTVEVDPQAARERRGLAPLTSLRVLWESVRRAHALSHFTHLKRPKLLLPATASHGGNGGSCLGTSPLCHGPAQLVRVPHLKRSWEESLPP